MSSGTVAGTIIGLTAVAPTTFNAAGYGANTYTPIGEITDGGEHGREFALVTSNPIATRGTRKYKGSFNEGNKTLQLDLDDEDAGQILAKQAVNSDNDYYFEVKYPDGGKDYFPAKVMSFKKATGSVDSMRSATISLEISTSKSGVGVVEVAPPPSTVNLVYTAGPNGSLVGVATQNGVPRFGTGTPVAAVPASGYVFEDWSDGSTQNPRIDANVAANVAVTANFQPE